MQTFLKCHIWVLKPFMESMKKYTENTFYILKDYLDNLYCEDDVPAVWIEELSKRLGVSWKAPSDDLSETASEGE